MYNLDFAAAHATFRQLSAEPSRRPDGTMSPMRPHIYFPSSTDCTYWKSDLFTDDKKFDGRQKLAPDPAVKAEFEKELAKSDELASKILAQNPDDKNALFSQVSGEWSARRLCSADRETKPRQSELHEDIARSSRRNCCARSDLLRRVPCCGSGELSFGSKLGAGALGSADDGLGDRQGGRFGAAAAYRR